MAFGRFVLDQEIHKALVEDAPKIRQAEWAKLLAWIPVVDGMKRWTATVLLAVVAAGSKGVRAQKLSELLDIQVEHIRARLVILQQFELVSSRYSDGALWFTQRLAEAPWPEWITPPVWALREVPTKSTIKPSKRLYSLSSGKILKSTQKIDCIVARKSPSLKDITRYHVEQSMKLESKENKRTCDNRTKPDSLQKFDTGFKPAESQGNMRTDDNSENSPQLQTSKNNYKPTKSQKKRRTNVGRSKVSPKTQKNEEKKQGKQVHVKQSKTKRLEGESKKPKGKKTSSRETQQNQNVKPPKKSRRRRNNNNTISKEIVDCGSVKGGPLADRLGRGQAETLLEMVEKDSVRAPSKIKQTPSKRKEVQGWQAKEKPDWNNWDVMGYWLHCWKKYYGDEDPFFVGHAFSRKDRKNVFHKAYWRLNSFQKRFLKKDGLSEYVNWLFEKFLPESDWMKDVLMFTQAFKLAENNFFLGKFLQRKINVPNGKKETWHVWGYEE